MSENKGIPGDRLATDFRISRKNSCIRFPVWPNCHTGRFFLTIARILLGLFPDSFDVSDPLEVLLMNQFPIRRCGLLMIAFSLFVAVPALVSQATMLGPVVPPTISISVDGFSGPNWEFTPAVDALEKATGQGRGQKLGLARAFQNILGNRANVEITQLEFDPDPFVLNNILVTNTTTTTQIFSAFVGLPTTFAGPNIISGTVRTNVIDGAIGGATVATAPSTPIYAAQIDGVTVATLQNHSFSVVCASC